MNIKLSQKRMTLFLFILLFIKITYQNIIGIFQIYDPNTNKYSWEKCYPSCYTCSKALTSGNQNCLSCDQDKGKYFLEGDNNNNCYTESELSSSLSFFLDKKQNPPKWVECHVGCATCSKKPTYSLNNPNEIIQMNCDTCDDDSIKVNTFCYEISSSSSESISFSNNGIPTYCGQLIDDHTGKQLGIKANGKECIIKPENTCFINNDDTKLLIDCGHNCGACEYNTDSDSIYCLKCINNFKKNINSNNCECPNHLGSEDTNQNCVNCKYSPVGPYNLNGRCVSSKLINNINYNIINSTYNIISKCKRPCLECDNNGRCITCRTNYYLDQKSFDNTLIFAVFTPLISTL